MKKKVNRSKAYYAHKKLRELGFEVLAHKRQINIPHDMTAEGKQSKYISTLLGFGYNIQYSIT